MGAWRDALFGTPEGKNPLGRPRRKCTYNVKVLLKKYGAGAWTELTWPRTGTSGGLL